MSCSFVWQCSWLHEVSLRCMGQFKSIQFPITCIKAISIQNWSNSIEKGEDREGAGLEFHNVGSEYCGVLCKPCADDGVQTWTSYLRRIPCRPSYYHVLKQYDYILELNCKCMSTRPQKRSDLINLISFWISPLYALSLKMKSRITKKHQHHES